MRTIQPNLDPPEGPLLHPVHEEILVLLDADHSDERDKQLANLVQKLVDFDTDAYRRLEGAYNAIGRRLEDAEAERDRLHALINNAQTDDFIAAVRSEAAHQIERWGPAHDRDKSAENWFWLVGYLAGKALRSAITGDATKAKHHCISSAAALLHWHTAISRDETGDCAGADADLAQLDQAA